MKISLSLHHCPRQGNFELEQSDILQCFDEIAPSSTPALEVTCIILDWAAFLQMLQSGTAHNFGEYAKDIFLPFFSPSTNL
jgi:hypothetical protein